MAKANQNIILAGLSGKLSNQLVIKQYRFGTVVSKYPDMSKRKNSPKQDEYFTKFDKAVEYARSVLKDAAKKAEYQSQVPQGRRVYNFIIAEFMKDRTLP